MIAVSYDALTGVAVIMVGAGVGVIGSIVTYLGPSGNHIGHKKSIKDTARVLGRAEIAHARYLDDAERLDPPLSEHISQAKSLVY